MPRGASSDTIQWKGSAKLLAVTARDYFAHLSMTILPLTRQLISPIVEEQLKNQGLGVYGAVLVQGCLVSFCLPREVAGRQQTHIAIDLWKPVYRKSPKQSLLMAAQEA